MGRKKKRPAQDPRDRIFCYYCDRTFNNEQELLSHQREKHLRCPTCNKRMISIPSLTIHSEQMHNVVVTGVPNAINGRTSVTVDVLGMNGIPGSYFQALEGTAKNPRTDSNIHPTAAYNNTPYQTYQGAHQTYPAASAYQAQYAQNQQHGYPQNQNYSQQYQYPPHQYPSYAAQHQPNYNYNAQYTSQNPTYAAAANPPYAHPQQQPYAAQSTAYPAQPVPYSAPPAYPTAQTGQHSTSNPQTSAYPYQAVTHPSQHHAAPKQNYAAQQHPQLQTSAVPRPVVDTPSPVIGGSEIQPKVRQHQTNPPAKPSQSNITIVFDRSDLSMEELRAELTRYRVTRASSS